MKSLPPLLSLFTILGFQHFSSASPIEKTAKTFVDLGDPVAISIGVIHKGKTTTWHHGTLSLGKPKQADSKTVYEIGSVTKVFTAMLLANEVYQNRYGFDTSVSELLPDTFKVPAFKDQQINLVQLATHTSHLPRIPNDMFVGADPKNPYAHYTRERLQESLSKQKVSKAPGSSPTAYSNLGYGLLGFAMAEQRETDYAALMDKSLLKPLSMTSTSAKLAPSVNYAKGYDIAHLPIPDWKFGTLAGAGGIRSNLDDMLKFAQFCLHPGKSPIMPTLELTLKPRIKNKNGTAQCLGWMRAADQTTYWHNGMTYGFSSYFAFNRKYDIAVCILSSGASSHISGLGEQLIRNFVSGKHTVFTPNRPPVKIPLTQKHLTSLTGNYQLSPTLFLAVTSRDKRLFAQITGQPPMEVYPKSPTEFDYHGVKASIQFNAGKQLTFRQNGQIIVARKLP